MNLKLAEFLQRQKILIKSWGRLDSARMLTAFLLPAAFHFPDKSAQRWNWRMFVENPFIIGEGGCKVAEPW